MKLQTYTNIFFDLDHTLWDFDANSKATLHELFEIHELSKQIPSADIFIKEYQLINKHLWDQYHKNMVDKETLRLSRFALTLEKFNIYDLKLSLKIADDYIRISPYKAKLFPQAHQVLGALSAKYRLHLITNGFKEVQHIKIKTSDLEKYFEHIFISEDIGYMKPHPEIFKHALKTAAAKNIESLMIGDNYEADIIGAKSVGMCTVYFNPERLANDHKSDYEIYELSELLNILL